MIYTHIMFDTIRNKRSYFIISLGVLLICAGLTGNLVTFIKSSAPEITGAFRFVEKITNGAVIETPSTNQSVEVDLTIKESTFIKSSIEDNSYFIHTSANKALEIPLIPEKIEIPTIQLVAPIRIADFNFADIEGETFGQWIPPSEFAAAWHPDSALIGQVGNTVINGHHNRFGEVFGGLINLKSGDMIYIYAKGKKYTYVVANIMILKERGEPLEVRLQNAVWLNRTDDERLTLVTCWPQQTNTHRLIIVARPY